MAVELGGGRGSRASPTPARPSRPEDRSPSATRLGGAADSRRPGAGPPCPRFAAPGRGHGRGSLPGSPRRRSARTSDGRPRGRASSRVRSQDIGEHRLTLGGTASAARRDHFRPTRNPGLPAPRRQTGGRLVLPPPPEGGQAVHAERGQQCLRIDMAVAGRALQPARTFRPAGRHARSFEIAAGHPVLGLGMPALAARANSGKASRPCLPRSAGPPDAGRPRARRNRSAEGP